MRRHAAILILFLGGCTTIGHQKVEGWPQLTVIEHHVPHYVMRDHCVKYAPWGSSPEACAEFNLEARTCEIWFSADFPPPPAFVTHERMHCDGYDHVGQTQMRDFLARYLEQTKAITLVRSPTEQSAR
jgi:hypothetical protein